MFIKQGDDGLDVPSLDDVQRLGALHQDAVEDLQDACEGPGTWVQQRNIRWVVSRIICNDTT